MNELSISRQYPREKFNLLGNTDVMVEIPEIKSPVVQAISLNPDPAAGDVYIQQKGYRDRNTGEEIPTKYAITKNGLKKLSDGAGITMVSSEHVIPSTCQKCAAVNANAGKVIQCGSCKNRDIAYRVRIAVPQLTGSDLIVEDTKEIILDNEMESMTDKQRKEFIKHYPQICEAKALNGAIRTALHIKGTYTREELLKPFVVAYLVPNLNQADVKKAAIDSMFTSSSRLFGMAPSVQQIESKAPEGMGAEDGENFDQFIDGTYNQAEEIQDMEPEPQGLPEPEEDRSRDFQCDKCGSIINEKVWDYSVKKYGRPLCYKCQRGAR